MSSSVICGCGDASNPQCLVCFSTTVWKLSCQVHSRLAIMDNDKFYDNDNIYFNDK